MRSLLAPAVYSACNVYTVILVASSSHILYLVNNVLISSPHRLFVKTSALVYHNTRCDIPGEYNVNICVYVALAKSTNNPIFQFNTAWETILLKNHTPEYKKINFLPSRYPKATLTMPTNKRKN